MGEVPPQGELIARIKHRDELIAALKRRLAELEDVVNWGTSCESCARVLDSAAAETFRREEAERRLAQVRKYAVGRVPLPHDRALVAIVDGEAVRDGG